MSGMLFKNAKIRKPGAKVVDKHEPRGHIRRIINGQKEKLKKVQAVKNYTKPDIVTKKPSIIVKNFGSLLKGVVKQGSVVLGCVQDVQMNTMVLSIPGCLGIVDVTRVSDAYTELTKLFINTTESTVDLPTLNEMFELGDILACAVVEKNTDSEFKSCDWALSINPKQVNIDIQKWNVKKKMILNCAVKSVEDHGYMMDTGCPGVFGFMPFANAESFLETRTGSERKRLPIGQVLPCAMSLLDGDNEEKPTSAVMLTADPHAVSHSHINRNCFSAEKLHLIPPGNRVKSTVHQIRPDGIVLRIKDCKAFVPRLHLANQWQSPADYEVGSMVKGKVLLYDKASETLLVTLREPLVENVKISLPGIYCGTIVETAEVTCIESDLTYFKINSDFRGIARKHHLDGVEVELNSQHECRIINSNILDDTVTVTLQQEVLRERYMSADEPRCGDVVQGIAGEISTDGHYCVEICKAVRGVITSAYLVHLPCDWKRGRELTCRVLKVDPQNGIVELVSLPRMVNSELPIISSYESAVPGLTTHGVFIAGNRSNSIVLFYNGIRGRVKLNSEIPLCKRWAVLDRGDVVTCVVRNGKPETQCLEIEIKDLKDHRGQFYSCTVVDVGNDGLTVEITENGMKECRFIPVNQLSDSYELNEPLLKTFQVGDTLKTVVSLKIDILSRKMSSIHWYKTHDCCKREDIKVGDVFPCFEACYLKESEKFVVIVGGCRVAILSQEAITDFKMGKMPGFVQITSVGARLKKMHCKVLDRLQVPVALRITFLKSYLQDLFRVQKGMFPNMWKSMSVGKIVDFAVNTKETSCIHGTVRGREAILFEDHYNGLTKEDCKAVIVYLDPFNNRVEVSCRKDFIKLLSPCKTERLPKLKERHLCTCLFVRPQFVLAALNGDFKKKVVYLPGVEYANTKLTAMPPWEIGSQLLVSIRTVKKNYCIGTVVESVPLAKNMAKKRSLDEDDSHKKKAKKLKKKVVS